MQAQFQIEGEYITKLARTWLWDEERELEVCMNLLRECLLSDAITDKERDSIATEILEGRKKLVGINTFELVEDNENIRSLNELIKKKEQKIKKMQLEEDMQRYAKKYIDRYVGGFSVHKDCLRNIDNDRQSVIDWLLYGDTRASKILSPHISRSSDYFSTPLQGGAHLLLNLDSAFQILGGPCRDDKEVNEKITIHFNKILNDLKANGIDYDEMNSYQRAFYERNLKAYNDFLLEFPYNKPFDKSDLSLNAVLKPINKREKEDQRRKNYKEYMEKIAAQSDMSGMKYDLEGTYKPIFLEEKEGITGFLAPDGKFFKTEFGGHEILAKQLMNEVRKIDDQEKRSKKIKEVESYIVMGSFIGYAMDRSYITIPQKELTRAQKIWFRKYKDYLDEVQYEIILPYLS
ncbi:MAG: hypothetical protein ACOCQR_02880 [bacterium]